MTAEEAWPRVEAAVRSRIKRARLGADARDEVLHAVYVAVLRRRSFWSARGAERFGVVVAVRAIRQAQKAQAERPPHLVPLDLADEAEAVPANPTDSPEDRAVLKAGFGAILAGLDPAPKAADLRALWYPMLPPAESPDEQRYWSVRLHRVRKRMQEQVRDLLAPAAIALRRVPRSLRAMLAGGVATSAGLVVVIGLGLPGAASGFQPGAGVARNDRAANAAVGDVRGGSAPESSRQLDAPKAAAPRDAEPGESSAPPRSGVGVRADTNVWRNDAAAGATSSRQVVVSHDGLQSHGETRVEVYCDSAVRARLCEVIGLASERLSGP